MSQSHTLPSLRMHSITYIALIRMRAVDMYKNLDIKSMGGRLIEVDDREPRNEVVEALADVLVPVRIGIHNGDPK